MNKKNYIRFKAIVSVNIESIHNGIFEIEVNVKNGYIPYEAIKKIEFLYAMYRAKCRYDYLFYRIKASEITMQIKGSEYKKILKDLANILKDAGGDCTIIC